jgi:hypothetical protein
MASDDVIVGANQNGIGPTPLADRSRDVGDLLSAVRARVVGPWNQTLDSPALDLKVALDRKAGIGCLWRTPLDSNRELQSSTVGRGFLTAHGTMAVNSGL